MLGGAASEAAAVGATGVLLIATIFNIIGGFMHETGQTYFATLLSSALSTAAGHDLLSLLSTGASRVEVVGLELQQLTTAPQPASVELWRGSTGVTAGSALAAVPREGWPAKPAAKSAITANSSTLLSTASAVRLHAGGFEPDSGHFCWRPEFPVTLDSSARFHARMGTPGPFSVAATIEWREVGKIPS